MLGSILLWGLLVFLVGFYQSNLFSGIGSTGYSVNVWGSSFECGFIGHAVKINNFSVGFFLLLVFFVLFDLEVSLLLNVAYQYEFINNLFYYVVFVFLLSVGLFLEVCFGYVNWSN
nr:NADH dehydrogenase subunit 3 [Cichlidogyrus casuarinus]